jgi:uncharacterized protein (UPF0335 family)
MGGNSSQAARLRAYIEEAEAIEAEIAEMKERLSGVFKVAKAGGLDPKAMRQIIKERRMDAEELREHLARCEVYRAALGMLGGTPLGEAARKLLEQRAQPKPAEDEGEDEPVPGMPEPAAPPVAAAPSAEDLLAARAQGAAAAKAGRKVTENPFGAEDARRAAWDEGWCAEAGSDGMDIPAAWSRQKPKKPKGEAKGEGKPDGKGH